MDKPEQEKEEGPISRLLRENAKKGFEFGKSSLETAEKSAVSIGQPQSNHRGIDRGRWTD